MSFINTVETVGDKALADSIIDRSITELNCNITTTIRQYAFRACTALTKVSFPSVTSIALGAFWQCTALTRAEFESTVAFANNAFYGCTALTALILRNTEAVSTITGTPFAGSAIASGTGYIYVPAALVDTYKANWSTYAAQIRAIEDYPEVCDLYSWAAVSKCISNGTYAEVYKVGDCIPLNLDTLLIQGSAQIVAFDADDLADGTGKASISWMCENLLKSKRTSAINWETSGTRAYLNDTAMPLFPEELQAMIKPVKKTQIIYSGGLVEQTTEDSLWVPSKDEIFGADSLYYPLFEDIGTKRKKRVGVGYVYSTWTLRSASDATHVDSVTTSGSASSQLTSTMNYTTFGFCT